MDKRFPKLKNRLLCLAGLVDPGARVADIGCDHGYLGIYLLREGMADTVVGVDISPGSIAKAQKNIARFGLTDKITLKCADGLHAIDLQQIDTVIVAGLGGEMIAGLLADGAGQIGRQTLLLSPMRREEKLRAYLYDNGFEIEKERLAQDDKRVHTLIKARRSIAGKATPYDAGRLYFGEIDRQDPLFGAYVAPRRRHLQKQLSHQRKKAGTPTQEKQWELMVQALAEMLKVPD